MKPALFSPYRFFIIFVDCVLIIALTGWVLWYLSATQYRRILDGWIEEGRAAGYQITYDRRETSGFPLHVVMRYSGVHWKNADGIDFHSDGMDIAAAPWNWHVFEASFKGHVSLAAPLDQDGHALLLETGAGHATAVLDDAGIWRQAQLYLKDSRFGRSPTYLFRAAGLAVTVERPLQPPTNYQQAGLTLDANAVDVSLPAAMPSPFGVQASRLATRMRVMGAVPDIRQRAAVDVWNKGSGIVEFDDLSINWGALHLAVKGTIGFDDDLQPEGAFAGSVGDPKATLQTLISTGFVAMHDQDMLDEMMKMLAKPGQGSGKDGAMQLPITIQLGGLFLGPVKVFSFPPIIWPTAPPEAQSVAK